jgi:hypothetical protein
MRAPGSGGIFMQLPDGRSPRRAWPWAVALSSLVVLAHGVAEASSITASASSFTGDPISVAVTIDDASDPGNLVITLAVESGGTTGDLRGFFAQVSDESVLSGLSVSGAQVTGSLFAADSVIDLGQGSNLNGGGSPCPCDLGVEIGAPGLGGGDDYATVTFVLSHESRELTAALFSQQLFGVRLTSVGDLEGGRNGSSKLVGVVPEPATGVLVLIGLAGLARARRARRS